MKKICRFSFNTAFIFPEHEIVFNKYELDPDAFQNNKKVSDGFAVFLEFMPVCKCASSMPISERCELCLLQLNSREKDK
jgi:C2 domain of PTEN tumour-suppressor protein.